ncbi:MAG: response regulator [Bacillota bacterium]
MLDTIVVDDEFHAVERLKEFVVDVAELNLINSYTQASNCLADIREEKIKPEVIFLDIEMPGYNGLQLAQRILEINGGIDIVFVTAYDNYAVEAFELNALDYLLKPITEDRFQKTIARLLEGQNIISQQSNELEIISLGKFDVMLQGEKINIEWSTVKTKELFLYLLYYQGDFVARDKIVNALWPEKNHDKAADILYTTVYRLRKIFKEIGFDEIIVSKRGFYALDLDQIKWDVIEFETIVEQLKESITRNIEEIDKIINLYQGEFLVGEGYKWAHGFRVQLKENFQNILLKAADYYEVQGENEKAIALLQQLIRETFLLERAYKRLIEIYLKIGDEISARRQYQKLAKKMNNEFGIEPEMDFGEGRIKIDN